MARLLVYSDCPVFGGADSVAVHLLDDPALRRRHEAVYSYRAHATFEAGVRARLRTPTPQVGVRLPDREDWLAQTEARVARRWPRLALKVLFRLAEVPVFAYDLARLTLAFARERPEVVHVNDGGYPGALGCRAAALAARLAGARRVVFVVHNQTRPLRLPWEALDAVLDAAVARCVDVFVTASPIAQASLAGRGFDGARMRIIRDGVPTPRSLRPRDEVRRELGLTPDEIVFLVLAFFEPRKGHRVLLDAVAGLGASADLKIVFVGDGPEQPAAREQARRLGLSERLLFLGYRQDAPDILNACDGLILPSVSNEDMPLAILDAMALSKPVISTRLAGIPEEVEHGVTGLLAEPGDPATLADAVLALARDEALRRSFGEAGRRRYEAQFSTERCAAAYADLYDELLRPPSGDVLDSRRAIR